MLWNNTSDNDKPQSTDIGSQAEAFAKHYLLEQGLKFVGSNFHSRQGEIDIIMHDGDTYVFIEVKYRKNNAFGGPISAVSASKQTKIRHAITFYLHQAGLNEYNTPCRIDVVALLGDIKQPQVSWIKDAF